MMCTSAALGALCLLVLFITVRNISCGKAMFSQACVKNSVHRRGAGERVWACVAGGMWWGACVAGRHAWQGMGGVCVQGVCLAGGVWQGGHACARETATAEDGTHPTGMHSCCLIYFRITKSEYNFCLESLYMFILQSLRKRKDNNF